MDMGGGGKMANDRGAEQGDVDGPLECAVTLGRVATATKEEIHEAQNNGDVGWINAANSGDRSEFEADWMARKTRRELWEATAPADRERVFQHVGGGVDPGTDVQLGGGIFDVWYLDDGDILTHPALALRYLRAFDKHNGDVGATRNRKKT